MMRAMVPPFELVVVLVIVTFLLAGLVKGVIGLGMPSIAIALLALIMTPAEAAAIMVVPTFVTNIWQMLVGPHLLALVRRLWPLLAASVVGIWLGGSVLTSANSRVAASGLGLALVIYAVIGLTKLQFSVPRRHQGWLSPLIGLTTGLIAGATAVFVIPAGPYYQAIGLSKDELVQMLGLSFTVAVVTLTLILWRDGVMHLSNITGSALAVLPALSGMALGQIVRMRTSEETFRKYFFAGLLLLGVQQAVRNLL